MAKYMKLKPISGGRYDQYLKRRQGKLPKNPNQLVDAFVDAYGVDAVVNMSEVDIGDYVYNKGIVHSQNMNVGRSIPWIEDGLKAVERRILYMMYRAKLYRGKFDKVAGVAGDMVKEVHPHGEASASDTVYRLGRSRSTMIPYIVPKGNYGNMHTMRPASPRYASASLSDYAMDCFFSEIGPKRPIYDEKDNYKYSSKEPVFLTSAYPNMLLQWNQGIGKGASAWLGAFNSKDLFKVAIRMLDDPDCKVDIYPDTPIPVDIINKSELKGCFDMKKFKVKMRSHYQIVNDKKRDEHGKIVDKYTIVFTSLPLSVKSETVEAELKAIKAADEGRANKRLPEVISMDSAANNDTPGGIDFYIEYEKGYDPEALVEKLFTMTSLAKVVGVQYALVSEYKPDLYTPREILKTWIMYRFDQKRRYYHQLVLKYAKDRARLDAICTVLVTKDVTDKTIRIIRGSKNDQDTMANLMKEFGFSEFQALSIIRLQLRVLSKMNIEEVKAERDHAHAEYKRYRRILTQDSAIKDAIREDLESGLKKYGKDRLANVVNLKDRGASKSNETKTIVYNSDMYYAVTDDKDLEKLKAVAGKDCSVVRLKNSDQVIVIASDGSNKILDGFAFSVTTAGIATEQLGITKVLRIIPITQDVAGLLLLTSSGYGKIMYPKDAIKSTKSRLMVTLAGDYLAAAIPLSTVEPDETVAIWTDNTVYCTKLGEFPILKRQAVGNRIWKFDIGTIRGAAIVPALDTHMMIWGDRGYAKVVQMSTLKFNRKRLQGVAMPGKSIRTILPITTGDSKRYQLYSWKGRVPITVQVGKYIVMTIGKDEVRIKPGNTISTPVKVLKIEHNEYYQFM